MPSASRTCSEPSEQCRRFEQSGARRGELDGERQTVEAPADLDDGARVVVGQGEVVADGPGSIDEQLHGGQRRQLLERRRLRERGHRQRADRVLALGAQPEHGAARGQDLERRGSAARSWSSSGATPTTCSRLSSTSSVGVSREVLDQDVERRARALDGRAHRGGDARQHQLGLGDRSERHEHRRLAGRDRPSCSPTAIASRVLPMPPGPVRVTSRTSGRLEQRRHLGDVVLAPDQRRRRHRQRARSAGRRSTPADAGRAAPRSPVANRSLRSSGQVVADQPAELARAAERSVGVGALGLELGDHRRQPRLLGRAPAS